MTYCEEHELYHAEDYECPDCIQVLKGRLVLLEEALAEADRMHKHPDESENEHFERIAEWFHSETGILAPGKDYPAMSGGPPDDRLEVWEAWHRQKNQGIRDLLGVKS